MAEDQIKSNKYSKVPPVPPVMNVWGAMPPAILPFFYAALRRITGYQHPPEEKERVLDEIPGPDFEIQSRDE